MDDRQSVSAMLRRYRRIAALTQEQLAEKTGLSVRTIRNLERGLITSPRAQSVRLLADALALAEADRALLLQDDRRPESCGTLVPRQLPATMRQFAGRRDELRHLDQALERSSVAVITGTAGTGKTTLAVHWAARRVSRFPNGQLHADLRGFGPAGTEPASPYRVLSEFLQALGVPADRVPAEPSARIGLYRTLLADKKVLVLLDNAYDAQQVRPLLPGGPGCFAVITSRDQFGNMIAREAAQGITLDPLGVADARELLARRLGTARVHAEPDAVADLISSAAGVPLALSIIAAKAVKRPAPSLRTLAEQMRSAAESLFSLSVDEATAEVRAAISAARVSRLLATRTS